MTTYLIDIPQVFAIDHEERDLPTGEQVKALARTRDGWADRQTVHRERHRPRRPDCHLTTQPGASAPGTNKETT